jgi:hypothetical protein
LWTTQPITSANPATYTVSFLYSDDDLLLIDKEGLPASPEVNIPLDTKQGKPGVIYVQQAASAPWWFKKVALTARVTHPEQPDRSLPRAHTIYIRLWPWWLIGGLEFFEILFGPTLTLASTAIFVIGIAVQQEIQRRESLNQKELDQKLKEIDDIKALVKTDMGKAVRLWWECTASNPQGKSDWQKPELQEALRRLWSNEIKDNRWQLALLTEAIGFFNRGKCEETIERAGLIHKIASADKSSEAIAARFLAACAGDAAQQIVNVTREVGAKEAVDAIWSLYDKEEFKSIVEPVVIQTLAELVGHAETITIVHTKLINTKEGPYLLKQPQFGEVLHRFIAEQPESEQRKLAQELQTKRQEKHQWRSSEFPQTREPSDTKELNWLRTIDTKFSYNPFVPLKAELDQNLMNYFIYPAVIDPQASLVRGTQPTVLYSNLGSGQTTTALILANDYQNSRERGVKGEIFPVYLPLSVALSSELDVSFYLNIIIKGLSEALINFLTINPYTFLEHYENQKFAIAYLLTYSAGSTQSLDILLRQTPLSNDNIGGHLRKRLLEKSQDIPKRFVASQEVQLEMLRWARPSGFAHTYMLLDLSVDSSSQTSAIEAAKQLQPLLNLMAPLAKVDVYLKLFLPLTLKQTLSIPRRITSTTLEWTAQDLRKLLKQRLNCAGSQLDSLDTLFDPDARASDPTEQLIAASEHCPGRLIELIDQLLKQQANKDSPERIDYATLEAVLKLAGNKGPIA